MKLNATRTRKFILVSKCISDGYLSEIGAANNQAAAGLMLYGFIHQYQRHGNAYPEAYFLVDAKTGQAEEYKVDRHSGFCSCHPAEPITTLRD